MEILFPITWTPLIGFQAWAVVGLLLSTAFKKKLLF